MTDESEGSMGSSGKVASMEIIEPPGDSKTLFKIIEEKEEERSRDSTLGTKYEVYGYR